MITLESIKQVVAQALKISPEVISSETRYQQIPEWDSFSHVELMLDLEKEYKIPISNDLVLNLTSVQRIFDWINSNPLQTVNNVSKPTSIHYGLKRVVFDTTRITKIRPNVPAIYYRGYEVSQLATSCTFEQVAYLLIFGEFPTAEKIENYDHMLRDNRAIPQSMIELLSHVKYCHPLSALTTSISSLQALHPKFADGCSKRNIGSILIALIPTVLAAHHRLRCSLAPISPDPNLCHAANLLYMLTGTRPSRDFIDALTVDLIVHADHSSTPSTFSARLATSAGSDIVASVVCAAATLGGGLHGGAPEKIIDLLESLRSPSAASSQIQALRQERKSVPGFGHRIYRREDPRVKILKEQARKLVRTSQHRDFLEKAEAIESEMAAYKEHGIAVNDDFYSSICLHFMGIPNDLFSSIAMASRISGLVAHIDEQSKRNVVMAPSLFYDGRPETHLPRLY